MIELNDNEIEHITKIMEERGTLHCSFCNDLFNKLKNYCDNVELGRTMKKVHDKVIYGKASDKSPKTNGGKK